VLSLSFIFVVLQGKEEDVVMPGLLIHHRLDPLKHVLVLNSDIDVLSTSFLNDQEDILLGLVNLMGNVLVWKSCING